MNFEIRLRKAQENTRLFFLRLTKDPFLAEEVLQFASVQCWRKWGDKPTMELTRLMLTVGRRFYLNHREKERNQKELLVTLGRFSESQTSSVDFGTDESCDQIRQALHRLPARWHDVLYRVFYLGQTNEEVAKALSQRLSTIKTWRRRGLDRLRIILASFSQSNEGMSPQA